ncbi:MAG: hypothetical protein WCS94_25375, partial [Verrucomicrobiota bacterium]
TTNRKPAAGKLRPDGYQDKTETNTKPQKSADGTATAKPTRAHGKRQRSKTKPTSEQAELPPGFLIQF